MSGIAARLCLWAGAIGLVSTCVPGAASEDPGPVRPFEVDAEPAPRGKIDELVFARLAQLGIRPARPASDEVFVRRVHLDAIGTLPTAGEVRRFLEDPDPDKRDALIDRLLEREEFADYQTLRWCDVLRVKAEFPVNLWPNAAQAYHRWIRTSLREDLPYDRFARELLTSSGSNFRVPQVNFYRAVQGRSPEDIAKAVALTFLGARAESWPAERLAGLAAFFSRIEYKVTAEWKEEIVTVASGQAGEVRAAFPDGTPAVIPADRDPRAVFADWLIAPGNPWFARNVVNRIWSRLLGRGIIHEPDDLRPDNPPWSPELLDWLEKELVAARWDLKAIYRAILRSSTYQLSSIPRTDRPADEARFASYPLRRLDAEVLIDALNQITGTAERYSSAIPEPFTFVPEGQRSIALPDGSISSAFLEMFGRPPRDTGLEAERTSRPSAAQSLHLLNSSHIQRKLEQGPGIQRAIVAGGNPRQVVTTLYLTILSRFPTDAELRAALEYARSGAVNGREASLDVAWALLNSAEFSYRH